MIDVVDLWKTFGDQTVLKGISLKIQSGTTYVVLGGSGSGKTVLMKHVIGLFKPDKGHVQIGDVNISALEGQPLNEARKVFGMVFQGAALFDSMTVFENVAFPLKEKRREMGQDEIRAKVIEKLKVVDLGEEVLEKWPAELSGGMRKRVGLARALITDPQIVLYDEPTTGLDPITTDYVDEMIKGAKAKLGITSMVISHDIASAFNVADRMAVLYDGQLAAEGTAAEIRASEHPFVKKFLSTWFEKQ